VLQLFRTHQAVIFEYRIEEGPKVYETTINGKKWEYYDDTVIGLAKDGTELVRIKVEEPTHERPKQHYNSI